MKKLLILFTLIFALTFVNNETQAQAINYPFGGAGVTTSDNDSLTLNLNVYNLVEFVEIESTTLDTILTINVPDVSYVRRGAELYIKATADGTNRDISFGTNITGTANTVTASKTDILYFIFDGSAYLLVSSNQIN